MSNSASINLASFANHSITTPMTIKQPLLWALVLSIGLHVVIAVVIPNLQIPEPKLPDLIEVSILPPPEPEPEPVAIQPEAPPEVVKPPEEIKPKIEPKPIIKPTPKPQPLPEPATQATETPPPATTDVIAVQKNESISAPITTPEPTPEPSPAPPPPPRVVDNSAARNGYGNTLWNAISQHKKYPRIAQARGWQGEVVLELLLDGNGKLLSKSIIQKSGYDVLDQQALEMVDKAAPFPAPPEALRGGSFSIKVPIPFKLEAR